MFGHKWNTFVQLLWIISSLQTVHSLTELFSPNLSSPGRWLATCRWGRTTSTCGLTLSQRVTTQTPASTYPSRKRLAEATWSRWEARSKHGRNAGLSLTATVALCPTMQVATESTLMQMYLWYFKAAMIKINNQTLVDVLNQRNYTEVFLTQFAFWQYFCNFSPTDKHEAKLKGVIYFQAIEEVYYDHLKSAHKVCGYIHVYLLNAPLALSNWSNWSSFLSISLFHFFLFFLSRFSSF